MNEPININGATLSPKAIDRIRMFQEENSECLNEEKRILGELLIEVVQQNVGDDNWTKFAKALADQLDFLNLLQA